MTAVLPTHVGVILSGVKRINRKNSTTHTRGGDPKLFFEKEELVEYYPHTWGWSLLIQAYDITIFVLPTHVGVILRLFS